MTRPRYSIFVSSPSDVRPERLIAERVVQKLAREFAHYCDVEAVLWEREPLVAGHHFQDFENIPPPRTTDICIVVLWSRLGVPLPPDRFKGAITGKPVTGTEWEFEDALASFRSRALPDLLLYQKIAPPMADLSDRAAVEDRLHQGDLVRDFIQRWLKSADGASFTAASHTFAATTAFEEQLEEHLRALLRRRLEKDLGAQARINSITWTAPPWRGLASFEAEQAAVFFGRTRARNEARETLAAQASAGKAFLLVMGASGSGKSSLVKAGLLPDLMLPGMIGRVALVRTGSLRPSNADGNPLLALARAVTAALPELTGLRYTPERLAEQLRGNPAQVDFAVEQGLAQAAQGKLTGEGEARLVLLVDQLEELFTADRIAQTEREAFVAALDALARSGLVWVIATLRSDFFDRLEALPALAALSDGGQYLLVPPTVAELGQIVRKPAAAAGLRFEVNEATDEGLDDVIVKAAAADPGALPLLSFALDQLWQRRDEASGVLTLKSYADLGGFEGALGHRAEEVLLALPSTVQAAFPAVILALVTVGTGPTAKATARTAPFATFKPGTPEADLVQALLAPEARLLVADGEGPAAAIRIAHEALLAAWPRARDEIARHWEDIQCRARVDADRARWDSEPTLPDDLLLPSGRRLEEAKELLRDHRDQLEPATIRFIERSNARDRDIREHRLRRLRAVAATMACFAFGAAVLAGYAVVQRHRADLILASSLQSVDALVADIEDHIRPLAGVSAGTVRSVLADAERTADRLNAAAPDAGDVQSLRARILLSSAETARTLGNVDAVLQNAQEAKGIMERLVAQSPDNREWRSRLAQSERWIGDALRIEGKTADALKAYQSYNALMATLTAEDGANGTWLEELGRSFSRLGEIYLAQNDSENAAKNFEKDIAITSRLVAATPYEGAAKHAELASRERLGDLKLVTGHRAEAFAEYVGELAETQQWAAQYPDDTDWSLAVAMKQIKVGDGLAKADAASALETYQAGLTTVKALVDHDIGEANTEWQRDLAAIQIKVGDAYFDQSKIGDARSYYERALAVSKKLAARDPRNADWQHDAWLAQMRCGDALMRGGDRPAANSAYGSALTMAQAWNTIEPDDSRSAEDVAAAKKQLDALH